MGTRSYICRQIGPDTYRTVFCQLEGHLESQGATLVKHYNSPEQVDKLLDLGDLYLLYPKLEPDESVPHNHSYRQEYVTVAFQRDCNCSNMDAKIMTLDELAESGPMIEYTYIFTKDNEWKYFQGGYLEEGLRDVKEDLKALEQGIDVIKPPPMEAIFYAPQDQEEMRMGGM